MIVRSSGINQHFTVVRTAHQVLHGVDQAEVTPVIAQDGKSDIGVAIFISGVGIDELLDCIEVFVQSLDLRITVKLQNLLLNPESGAAYGVDDLRAISQTEVRDDVQNGFSHEGSVFIHVRSTIAVNVRILQDTAQGSFDMLPQQGGLFLGDVVQQVNQSTAIDDQVSAVAAGEDIRIVFVGNFQAQAFIQGAGNKFKLKFDPQLFLDQLVDLVVRIWLLTGVTVRFVVFGTTVPFAHIMIKMYVLQQWRIWSFLHIDCCLFHHLLRFFVQTFARSARFLLPHISFVFNIFSYFSSFSVHFLLSKK